MTYISIAQDVWEVSDDDWFGEVRSYTAREWYAFCNICGLIIHEDESWNAVAEEAQDHWNVKHKGKDFEFLDNEIGLDNDWDDA